MLFWSYGGHEGSYLGLWWRPIPSLTLSSVETLPRFDSPSHLKRLSETPYRRTSKTLTTPLAMAASFHSAAMARAGQDVTDKL